jgi:hypothetical protein
MLENSTKKKLREHDWISYIKNETNPSQSLARCRSALKEAISQLILLANKLPNDEQEEILTKDSIREIIQALLSKNIDGIHSYKANKPLLEGKDFTYDAEHNKKILQIAALLVQEGTRICKEQYEASNVQELSKYIIEPLDNANAICSAMALTRVIKSSRLKYNVKDS